MTLKGELPDNSRVDIDVNPARTALVYRVTPRSPRPLPDAQEPQGKRRRVPGPNPLTSPTSGPPSRATSGAQN